MSEKPRVLILQHIAENPPGRIGEILQEYNIPYIDLNDVSTVLRRP